MKIYEVYVKEIYFDPAWDFHTESWYQDLQQHKTIIGIFLNKKHAEKEAERFDLWQKRTQLLPYGSPPSLIPPCIETSETCYNMDNLLEFYGS